MRPHHEGDTHQPGAGPAAPGAWEAGNVSRIQPRSGGTWAVSARSRVPPGGHVGHHPPPGDERPRRVFWARGANRPSASHLGRPLLTTEVPVSPRPYGTGALGVTSKPWRSHRGELISCSSSTSRGVSCAEELRDAAGRFFSLLSVGCVGCVAGEGRRGVMVGLASPHPGRDTSPCYLPVTGQNQPSRASQTASLRGAPSGYTGEGDTVFPELNRSGRDVAVPS